MEIGNQIRALRLERSITQEEMAQHLGVTAQAVSKWERGTAAPDIALLPEISAYFGVTIDALFALSDETRMERIDNMIGFERNLDPAEVESSRRFLLDKARREPDSGRPHELLADIEMHLAQEHQALAAEYAREALERDPELINAHSTLVAAMNGKCWDWCESNHHDLIGVYQDFLARHPDNWHGIMWLMDQLLDVGRLEEAEIWRQKLETVLGGWRPEKYRGVLLWMRGQKTEAYALWDKLTEKYPHVWSLWDTIADYMARDCDYEGSVKTRRKAMEMGEPPRFTDSLISIAQICEIQGDPDGAIRARKDQLELLKNEWHITEGEVIDSVRREIERLKRIKEK